MTTNGHPPAPAGATRTCAWFTSHVSQPVETMTGIGRYVVELVAALTATSDSGWGYVMSAPRAAGRPDWLPERVPFRPALMPRRPLRVAWSAFGRPTVERWAGRFDLVHALHSSSPVPSKRPVVMTVHDLMPVDHPEWYTPAVSWAATRALKALVDGAGQVIVDSQFVADQVRERGIAADRITVVHLGVRNSFFADTPEADRDDVCRRFGLAPDRYFLAVGNVATRKNLNVLVRALDQAGLEGFDLALAGRAHTASAHLQAEIDRARAPGRVRQLGFVPDADLPALMQSARALLHPAVDEGFGLPPLEAMAGGTPVVAADAGSLPEVIGSAGILLAPTDVDAWSGAVNRLATDDSLHHRLSEAGRKHAGGFTWEAAADKTRQVYERAVS